MRLTALFGAMIFASGCQHLMQQPLQDDLGVGAEPQPQQPQYAPQPGQQAYAQPPAQPSAQPPGQPPGQPMEQPMSPHAQQSQPQVIVNGEALPAQTVQALQSRGVQVAAGRYWYDAKTGAWGFEGHGTAGVLMPGLPLGGPLRADASRGSTGVFINGRQLPMTDVMALQAIGIPAQQGRFWCDAQGNCGREGQAWPLVNLYAAAKKARGGNGKSWYHKSGNASDYTSVGGDGKGFSYVTSKSSVTGKTTSYYFGD